MEELKMHLFVPEQKPETEHNTTTQKTTENPVIFFPNIDTSKPTDWKTYPDGSRIVAF